MLLVCKLGITNLASVADFHHGVSTIKLEVLEINDKYIPKFLNELQPGPAIEMSMIIMQLTMKHDELPIKRIGDPISLKTSEFQEVAYLILLPYDREDGEPKKSHKKLVIDLIQKQMEIETGAEIRMTEDDSPDDNLLRLHIN